MTTDPAPIDTTQDPVYLVCNRCGAEVNAPDGKPPLSHWAQDTEGEVEFGDGAGGPKGQWWHKCYEESLAPGWAPASVRS